MNKVENQSSNDSLNLIRPERLALLGLSLSMLLSTLGTSIVNVALPELATLFSITFQEVQWAVIAYLLSITALVVSVGRLGDLSGHKRMLQAGISIFTIASLLASLAPNFWILVGARAVQGVGAAIMMALTIAFVSRVVSQEKTGRAMGLLITMSAVGTALGPPLGGILIDWLSWRYIFLVNLPLGVVAYVLAGHFLPPDEMKRETGLNQIDYLGTTLLTIALVAYTLSMTVGQGRFGTIGLALLTVALLTTILFVVVESRSDSPLIQLEMFRDLMFTTNLSMNLLVTAVLMATLVVGPFYLSLALGLNAAQTGFAMAVGPIVAASTSFPAGMLVDRFGTKRVVFVGLAGVILGSTLLSLLPISYGVPGYLVALACMTMGYATFLAANNTAVMKDVSPKQSGVVSGMLSLSRNLGLLTGASAMGAVFAFATKTTDITTASPDVVSTGMQTTFAVSAGLILIALCLGIGGHLFSTRRPAEASG